MSGNVKLLTPSSGSVTITTGDTASNLTVTVPAATDTLVNLSSSQTLNNKTLSNPAFTGSPSGGTFTSTTITAANGNTVEATSGPTSTQLAGQRNKIINGAMMIDQRNAGASVALNGTENYVIDRWVGCSYGGNSVSFARSTIVPSGSATDKAFANSFSATNGGSTAAGTSSFYSFRQKIEGTNIYDLGLGTASAKSFTVSFWARSSVTGTYVVAVLNGAANWSNRTTYTINSANTWEYKTVTFAGTSSGTWVTDNTTGMYLDFTLSAGSNQNGASNTWISGAVESDFLATNTWCATNGATFYITGVQLEKGATATPFENRLYGTELALCQRYYNQIPSATLSGATFYYGPNIALVNISLPVTPRATPSVSYTNNLFVLGNATSIAVSGTPASITLNSPAYVQFTVTATGIVANTTYWFYTSSGALVISAEL